MTGEEFINKYVGTPHVYDGRDASGMDCWGLVLAWYKEVLGVDLPDWRRADHSRAWVARLMTREVEVHADWVDEPTDHAIMFVERVKLSHHTGVYYRGGVFHAIENGAAVWRRFDKLQLEVGGNIRFARPKYGH